VTQGFDDSIGYVLHQTPSIEPRIRTGPSGSPVVRGFHAPRTPVDQKSIFVGNLPQGTTREELHGLFQEFGTIVQASIVKKPFGKIHHAAYTPLIRPGAATDTTPPQKTTSSTCLRLWSSATHKRPSERRVPK
jgi:hypothetical protein